MAELIYNIEEVFGSYLADEQRYNIPEYQRGYKWRDQQIEQLLDDINEFHPGDENERFYCLQNITLVYHEEGNKLNVVDGQQRLTTIALLLTFLEDGSSVINKINYAVREKSNEFLQRIISNEDGILGQIKGIDDFDEFVETTGNDYDFQDIYFFYSAIRTMDEWFKRKLKGDKPIDIVIFKSKLLHNVKIIVNRITGIAEQDLFMSLNAGRVQLDGSDLVRAILITRVAKQEMEEFDSTEVKDVVRLNERRIRIGWELDELNAWWSNGNVFEYFSMFTSLRTGQKETIQFDQKNHPVNLLYKIWAESKNEKEIKLGLFEAQNMEALDVYMSIILLHRTLKDWYEDREIYHYLGFLFSQSEIKFNKVWNKWVRKECSRKEFILFLKEDIQELVFGVGPDPDNEKTGLQYWLDKIKDYDDVSATNWYETPQLENFLLTLDIIEHSLKRDKGIPIPYLKPRYFENFNEDKEHIFPGSPKDIKEILTLPNPEESFKKYINVLNNNYEGEKLIEWNFSADDWANMSDDERGKHLNLLKHEIHQKRPVNSIGNLVLLHMSINRGFGNDYYSDKRTIVINNTECGEYVRHHTLKVFVKQTDNIDLNNWTMQDIINNANTIHDTLKAFFN